MQVPHYSLLPNSGKILLSIDGRDFPGNRGEKTLPKAKQLKSLDGQTNHGKYFHFGLESALAGKSPGIIHRDADLFQYVDLYHDDPSLLPRAIRQRVRSFHIFVHLHLS